MHFSELQLSAWLAAFMWPLMRVGAMLIATPVFNSRQTPVRLRIGLAVVITWLLVPVIPQPPVVDVFSSDAFLIALQQILIGVMMGFMVQMVFGALVFGGQTLAYSMGLGFASMMDPQNGVQVPVVAQLYIITATLMFLVMDGHLFLLEIMAQSFTTFPVAVDGLGHSAIEQIIGWASRMFAGGLLIALPAVAVLLLVNLGMGIITRAAPQLNIFAVGFPMTIMIGFFLLWITLPNAMVNFGELLEEALSMLQQILRIVR